MYLCLELLFFHTLFTVSFYKNIKLLIKHNTIYSFIIFQEIRLAEAIENPPL